MANKAENTSAESQLESSTGESKGQIDDLLKSLGLTPQSTMAELSEALTKSGGATPQQFGGGGGPGGISGFLEATGPAVDRTLHDIGSGNPIVHALFRGLYEGHPDAKKSSKKKVAAASPTSDALQAISNYLTSMTGAGEAAMGVEGQQLAQQNQAVTQGISSMLAGGGTSSGSPAVDAASAAYAKAYATGEGFNSAAYANMGAANAQYLQSAPEQPIVNLLTQGLGSGQFKELPQSLVQSLPESVQYALAQAGVGESQGITSTPSYGQPIAAPKGGWPKSLTGTAGSNTSGSSASQLAQIIQGLSNSTNPNVNTGLNQTLTPGTASTAGS